MSSPDQVAVSVIVPVRNRRDMLADLLGSLDAQTRHDLEVIVIDDGSTDGSGQLARDTVVAGRPVMVIDGGGKGAVATRRLGVECATASVLAFTDSDCIVDPRWLEHGLAALDDGADVVNGHTRPTRPLRGLERSVASGTEGLYPTCNMLYRRELYEKLGGFDPTAAARWRFRPTNRAKGLGFGEDTLLAWQAVRAGADVRFVPDALVAHRVFPFSAKETVSRHLQTAAFPRMIKEVPELRDTLMWRRLMLGGSRRLPLYGAVAALALRRPRLAALAVGIWALERVRHSDEPLAQRLAWLPAQLVVDLATSGALVVGSVSARSLVL